MQNPCRRTPICIGRGYNGAATHEKRKDVGEVSMLHPRKYVTCHAAHAGRAKSKGCQRGVWSQAGCKKEIDHARVVCGVNASARQQRCELRPAQGRV